MRHLKPINQKAHRIETTLENDVVALQGGGPPAGPHIPMGCSFVFSPGWEVDSSGGTVASGHYYDECRRKEPSEVATPQLAAELWDRSVGWVGLAGADSGRPG